ncbi:MAG TPA: AlkA N-terminal domain-containing protein [Kineosporiaceae bacterium]|nr:AlkA N-terminal domain-containing protein [Kineosporiaceae bacterium]
MYEDVERCPRIVQSRDQRFDGWFITGSPLWNNRTDLVARAVRSIADGVMDDGGLPALAARLGYSTRQVERALQAELGAGPLALARAQRARTARILIETTTLPMPDVASAAGFADVRSFNDAVRDVFGSTPTQLRRLAARPGTSGTSGTMGIARTAGTSATAAGGALELRLPFRAPLNPDNLFGHLAATAVPGVEEWRDGAYRRTLRLPHGSGIVTLRPLPDHIACRMLLSDLRDVAVAVNRCRRMLDLDADPVAVDDVLRRDPFLAHVVGKAPGRRVPGSADGAEFAVRAVLGQQVSTAAARTHAGRLVLAHGERVDDPEGGLTHLFPEPAALAGVDPTTLAMPLARRSALVGLIQALARGEISLDPGADRTLARMQLAALPGLGPWTVESIAMRGLGDPDAFIPTDLGIRMAARLLGLPGSPAQLVAHAEAWRPWRAYAVQYLWATGDHPVNVLPSG